MTYILYIASVLGALTTIIGFATFVSKPFRTWIINRIKKNMKDTEQDIMLKSMHDNIQNMVEQNNLMHESNLALLRDRITVIYYKYINSDGMPSYIRENLVKQYESYVKLGGNSYVSIIYNELLEVPVKK